MQVFENGFSYLSQTGNREYVYRYLDARFYDLKFDGVSLRNPFTGKIDLDKYYFIQNNINADADSTCSPVSNTCSNLIYKTKNNKEFNATLLSGNAYNGFSAGLNNKNSYFNFLACASYVSGYDYILSDKDLYSKYSNSNKRIPNSSFSTTDIYSKIEFHGNDAKISLSLATIRNSKNKPLNTRLDSAEYIKNPGDVENIINLGFFTLIADRTNLSGNIFFRSLNDRTDKYDDSTFKIQVFENSYSYRNDSYSYGGSGRLSFLEDPNTPLNLEILYKRDVVSMRFFNFAEFQKYETEELRFTANQRINFSESFIEGSGSYVLLRPVFSGINSPTDNLTGYEFNLSYLTPIINDLNLSINANSKLGLPSIKEIYFQQGVLDNSTKEIKPLNKIGGEVRAYINENDYLLSGSFFIDNFNASIFDFSSNFSKPNFKLGSGYLCYGSEFKFKLLKGPAYLDCYLYNAVCDKPELINRFDNLISKITLGLFLPYDVNLAVSAIYDESKIYALENNDFKSIKAKTLLMDFKAQAKIFSNFDVFFFVRNLTDRSYESSYGVLGQGRNLVLGISAKI